MIGIPFRIRRESARGVEDTTIYLRTHRMGDAGSKMRDGIRRFHDATIAQSKAASRSASIVAQAMKGMDGGPLVDAASIDLDALLEKQDKEMVEARKQQDLAIAAAADVAVLSLQENYPVDIANGYVDQMTDRELRALISTVEMGAMPADFFSLPGIPPSPSSTGPSGGSPVSDSSKQVSPGETLKQE